ncbi:uncharacterized protein K460DRAFT_111364 [Cucurbitaria berberidis CBS 394.84]|uniref:Endo-1,3(4)-beta-glucanase 1 carbohydrate binding domain-containing protein n=1 Tax=Cucurbitaria berberidis CBS 394.84 TaxID=1168544 RepID=A0A9P4GHN0_9PLEO|nr:uncharacterized protein K460DRAFT_111364 [Cucurbitaria berberidis CBS 394.84]KAF1845596.1 hypothetical protein K460DRAFT_111364 [Cucurbitaria berberidis CBS 394.84]
MKFELLLLLPMAGLMFAGPARRDCGETKSFVATNGCGMTYGGTWVECATGITGMPTFTVPLCSTVGADPNVAPEATPNPTSTESDPLITPAPVFSSNSSRTNGNATSTCSPLWICVDLVAACGNAMIPHGECYDTCTKSAPSTPACDADAASATGIAPVNGTRAMPKLNFVKAPPREHKSWCDEKPWMCAPKGW